MLAVMGRVPPPKQTPGCLQTLLLSRMIAQILFVPLLLIGGAAACIVAVVYAATVHFTLAFAVLALTVAVLTAISRWEYIRVKRELPPDDDVDPADPRAR